MTTNLLLTGASGYIGGTLLESLRADFPALKVFALVRTDAQSSAVSSKGCTPVVAALDDAAALKELVVQNDSSFPFLAAQNEG